MKPLTMQQRRIAYAESPIGRKFPASVPWVADDQRLYGQWVLGQDYRSKSGYHGCLDPGVKVLTADLRWVPNGDLREGDELVGVDEHGSKKKFRRTRVEKIGPVRLSSCVLTFSTGQEITGSLDHQWLVIRDDGCAVWKTAAEVKVGDRVRKACPTWINDPVTANDRAWLSGIIDGEGSYDDAMGFRLSVHQNEGKVLNKIRAVLDACQVSVTEGHKREKCRELRTTSCDDTIRLLGLTRPVRFDGAWEGVAMGIKDPYATVTEKREIGLHDLVGMETGTKTFIAEGLVSHNSFPPNYLERVMALFPDAERVLHLFAGSLPASPKYTRLDMRDDIPTDVQGDAQKCDEIFKARGQTFDLIHADPPYTQEDAIRYGVPMVNRNKVVEAATKILEPGGYLVWFDMTLPMYAKVALEFAGQVGVLPVNDAPVYEKIEPTGVDGLEFAGQVGISRSTNHRFRVTTIWRRI